MDNHVFKWIVLAFTDSTIRYRLVDDKKTAFALAKELDGFCFKTEAYAAIKDIKQGIDK